MNLNEIQNLLTTLMRGIDKKTALRVEYRTDAEKPRVEVHLSRERRNAVLQLSESVLGEAQADLMGRNRLRTTLKRARDGMWEGQGNYIFSTKMERPKQEGGSWFKSNSGGGGRGRR